jgi:hypothetical protein
MRAATLVRPELNAACYALRRLAATDKQARAPFRSARTNRGDLLSIARGHRRLARYVTAVMRSAPSDIG